MGLADIVHLQTAILVLCGVLNGLLIGDAVGFMTGTSLYDNKFDKAMCLLYDLDETNCRKKLDA